MTEFTQTISDNKYKKAIAIHYFGYKYTYIGPVLGCIMLLGLLILAIMLPKGYPEPPFYMYFLGAFLLLRPIYYIHNVHKNYKTGNSSAETHFKITRDKRIEISNNGNLSSLNLKDLYAYSVSKTFIFLYVARNQYLFLEKRQMDETSIYEMLNNLNSLGIKNR